uniref:Choline/carnitine acyltransferase domain-containing protein n=1 Tax=Plectus sambesii TaxID=2011161 RepID=A0A914V5I9_9BILA
MTRETFQQQSQLPSLPVPQLEQTIDKYLDAVRAFLSPEEFRVTEQIARHFERHEAPRLQAALVNKAATERNWLENWWDDVYLDGRYPLLPWSNFAGINPRTKRKLPGDSPQLNYAADMIHHCMRYWLELRRETVPLAKNRGAPLDMNQVYRLFNATRMPCRKKDRLVHYFRTDEEGHTPSHVIVLCRGHFWHLETMSSDGQIYSPEQFMQSLQLIRRNSVVQKDVHHICSLTTMNRDEWAEMRERLVSQSPENARCMELIESSVMIVSLTDVEITDDSELMRYSLLGDPRVQWADKSINVHVQLDGQSTVNCDHSNIDAIALLQFMDTAAQGAIADADHWRRTTTPTNFPNAIELVFAVDSVITDAIARAEAAFYQTCNDVDVRIFHYSHMGNNDFRKAKIYGDTVVQLSLQLAYYRLHNRPAPTYETSSTRKFFHGRTETVRSCTQEAINFAKTMLGPTSTLADKRRACKLAYDTHNRLMAEASNGQGIDRHLLGLRRTAEELSKGGCSPKISEPAIFRDEAWKKSGGDGNFILSTSFLGYDSEGSFGYVVAMCKDGYGTFYKINDSSLTFTCTAYKSSSETRLAEWVESIRWSLDRISECFALPNSSKL